MPKKSPALKSAKKSAPQKFKRSKPVAKAAWTINSVGDLLDAVNKVTLKRMEEENETTLNRIENKLNAIGAVLKDFKLGTLPGISDQIQSVEWVCLNRLEPPILAIKKKVEA